MVIKMQERTHWRKTILSPSWA